MATAPSLFGATPDEIRQQQAGALDAQALQYAQMDPFQRASYGIYRGANQLGGAIGGMLGGTDPQMERASQRQEMVKGLDQSDPQSWLQLARKAQEAGDYAGSQEAVVKAQALQKAALEGRKTEADISSATATAAGKTFDISVAGRAQALAATGKFTSSSIQGYVGGTGQLEPIDKFTKPAADFIAKAVEFGFGDKAAYGGYTPEQTGKVNQALLREELGKKKAGAPKTDITLGGNKYAENVGGEMGKGDVEKYQMAQTLPASLVKVDDTLSILKNTDINTGLGAELFTTLDRARTKFATDKAAGVRVSNTEYLNSLLGSEVFPLIQSLGIGARGMDTPAEREFLRAVMTGTISLDKQTLIRMAEGRKSALLNAAKQYNKTVDSGELNRFFDASGRNRSKIEIPVDIPTQMPPASQIPGVSPPIHYASNPSTGQKLMSTDGGLTWQPRR